MCMNRSFCRIFYLISPIDVLCAFVILETAMGTKIDAQSNEASEYVNAVYEYVVFFSI